MTSSENPLHENSALILAIDDAFGRFTGSATKLPGRSDQEGWAVDELIDKLSGGDLQPADVCYQHMNTVSFCSEQQFGTLLPALLRLSVSHWHQIDVMADNIVYKLIPPDPSSNDLARFEARMKQFTLLQRSAIHQFLAWVTQKHGDDFVTTDLERAKDWWSRPNSN